MKKALFLVFVYLLVQLLVGLIGAPLAFLPAMSSYVMPVSMLLSFVVIVAFLWKKGYLTEDKQLYSPLTSGFLMWSLLLGISIIALEDALMILLSFLPDWMEQTFDAMETNLLGILCIAIIGPVVEELYFRGAIAKELLKQYTPVKAILLSGLLFGLIHFNPVQVVGASIMGILLGWLYYKSKSLMPCILIHIFNNSLAVYLNRTFPDVDYTWQLMGKPAYMTMIAIAIVLAYVAFKSLLKEENNLHLNNNSHEEK